MPTHSPSRSRSKAAPAPAPAPPPSPDARQRDFNQHAPVRELDIAEARACVIEQAARLAPHRTEMPPVPPPARVLAIPIVAERDRPPFPRAQRDGYALRAADCAQPGAALRCQGQVRPGAAAAPLEPNACYEIMTGAAVPEGADAVVMLERTLRPPAADTVTVTEAVTPGQHIMPAGGEGRAGERVLAPGRRLDAVANAMVLGVARWRPAIYLAPTLAVLAIGDELVEADQHPGPLQIRNTNGPMIAGLARRSGAVVQSHACIPDDLPRLRATLENAVSGSDIVVVTGGASVGATDLTAQALTQRGAKIFFDAVRMRPGRPVRFGEIDGKLCFALPGNPISALVAYLLFVHPALELIAGIAPAELAPAAVYAKLGADWSGPAAELTLLRPVRLRADGLDAVADDLHMRSSADLATAAAADGFWMIPPGAARLKQGTMVPVVLKLR